MYPAALGSNPALTLRAGDLFLVGLKFVYLAITF